MFLSLILSLISIFDKLTYPVLTYLILEVHTVIAKAIPDHWKEGRKGRFKKKKSHLILYSGVNVLVYLPMYFLFLLYFSTIFCLNVLYELVGSYFLL